MKIKLFTFLLFILTAKTAYAVNISVIRELFYKAIHEEAYAEEMLTELDKNSPSAKPILSGYKGIAFMLLAKYAYNPLNKYNYFTKGKHYIETAILNDPANIELRYLRLIVQNNVPSFLMYSTKLQEDKNAIMNGLNRFEDEKLKSYMIQSLLQFNMCSEKEINKFR